MPASIRAVRALLAGFALCALAGASGAQRSAVDAAERVDALLQDAGNPHYSLRAAEQLAQLGFAALGPIFERLQDEAPESVRRAALLAAVGMLPCEGVLAFLSELARPATAERARIAALDLLARLGGRAELPLAIELVGPVGATTPPAPALTDALVLTFTAISSRDAGAVRELATYFARVEPAIQTCIVSAIRRARPAEAPSLLAALLGRASDGADALVLSELAASSRAAPIEDLLVFERVRGYLGHPNKALVVLACTATSSLADDGAVPDLIVLLCDELPNVRRAAHAALMDLTGLHLAPEPHMWMGWLDQALAWWDERADPCRVALVSGSATEAAAAIQEVARQRLFVRDVVKLLTLALHRAEPDLVAAACKALKGVPPGIAHVALPALAALPDLEIARATRDALARSARSRPAARLTVLPRTKTMLP